VPSAESFLHLLHLPSDVACEPRTCGESAWSRTGGQNAGNQSDEEGDSRKSVGGGRSFDEFKWVHDPDLDSDVSERAGRISQWIARNVRRRVRNRNLPLDGPATVFTLVGPNEYTRSDMCIGGVSVAMRSSRHEEVEAEAGGQSNPPASRLQFDHVAAAAAARQLLAIARFRSTFRDLDLATAFVVTAAKTFTFPECHLSHPLSFS
jgi:hypothetical protein